MAEFVSICFGETEKFSGHAEERHVRSLINIHAIKAGFQGWAITGL
jgi:hypothetical protein